VAEDVIDVRVSSAGRDSSLSSVYHELALALVRREYFIIHRHHSSKSDSTQKKIFTPNGSSSLKDTVKIK